MNQMVVHVVQWLMEESPERNWIRFPHIARSGRGKGSFQAYVQMNGHISNTLPIPKYISVGCMICSELFVVRE